MPEPITSSTPPGTLLVQSWPLEAGESRSVYVVMGPHSVGGALYTMRFQHGRRSHYNDGSPRRFGIFGSELRGVSDA